MFAILSERESWFRNNGTGGPIEVKPTPSFTNKVIFTMSFSEVSDVFKKQNVFVFFEQTVFKILGRLVHLFFLEVVPYFLALPGWLALLSEGLPKRGSVLSPPGRGPSLGSWLLC